MGTEPKMRTDGFFYCKNTTSEVMWSCNVITIELEGESYITPGI